MRPGSALIPLRSKHLRRALLEPSGIREAGIALAHVAANPTRRPPFGPEIRIRRSNRGMATEPRKRVDLGEWLADLRRVGGQARSLAERPETVDSLMNVSDLQMLEEATKRILVAMSQRPLYGIALPRDWEGADRSALARPGGAFETGPPVPAAPGGASDRPTTGVSG